MTQGHPSITTSIDLKRALFIEKAPGQTIYITVEVTSTSQLTPRPVWSIGFRSNEPSSEVFSRNDNSEFSLPGEDGNIYVTHWEQIGDEMRQLEMKP